MLTNLLTAPVASNLVCGNDNPRTKNAESMDWHDEQATLVNSSSDSDQEESARQCGKDNSDIDNNSGADDDVNAGF